MADPEIWRALLETGNPYIQQERQQKGLMGMMELQEKQRQMEDVQRLRDLYSSGNEPSIRDVMAISPEFGMKMQGERLKQIEQQLGMQKTQTEIGKLGTEEHAAKAKVFANVLGPIAEQFPSNGNPSEWKARVGTALANIEKMHGIKPDVNFEDFTPEQVLQTSEGFGYSSMRMKQRMEKAAAYGSGYGRAMAPVPAGVDMTPQGPMVRPGLPSGMTSAPDLSQFGPATKSTAEDIPMLEEAYKAETDPNRKFQIGKTLNDLRQQTGFITPQQASEMRVEEKRKEAEIGSKAAGETKSAQIKAEEEAADKKAVDAYFRMKPPEQVRDLIKESLAGDLETSLAKLGKLVGVSTPGGAPTAALKVITQQLASTSPFAPGSQSDVEYKARLAKIGDPASDEPIENRLAALDEFYRDQEAFITQKWKPESQNDILDMRAAGYISEDNARKVFRRFKQSKSGAM
jgi:hypothetical protein